MDQHTKECVHPLEPGSHKELGPRLMITFGNSPKGLHKLKGGKRLENRNLKEQDCFLKVVKLCERLVTDHVWTIYFSKQESVFRP